MATEKPAFDDRGVDRPRKLSERPFEQLLAQAISAEAEGLVVLRDREGVRHGIWVQRGYVVGAYVAGRFDPLLSLLAGRGRLDAEGLRRCLAALPHAAQRSGALARLAGVSDGEVHDALQEQLLTRYLALLALAAERGHDAQLEPGPVPAHELSARLPLGTLRRRAVQRAAVARDEARRALRALAKARHPDRALDPSLRDQLTRELAEATAAYHGFR
ncbi:MAG TPA: hypothetical protein VFX59_19155 [Polyangiales bacterium]|nr:hypothetical protein [Polyangiales bacterium]